MTDRARAQQPSPDVDIGVGNFFTKEWWEITKHHFPQDLQNLTNQFISGEDFLLTSKYWLHLIKVNYEMLKEFGIDSYATNIARNYFTWTDFDEAQIKNLITDNIFVSACNDIFKKHDGFTFAESYKHNVLINLLYGKIKENQILKEFVEMINDNGYLFGNAPYLKEDNLVLTLDKLSSLLEFLTFKDFAWDSKVICEIGGGSGRSSDAILQLTPEAKLIYADIPPASFVAYNRFSLVFPDKEIHLVKSNEELVTFLTDNLDWDILMIAPEMLSLIPDKYVDLVVAIDCLHEFGNENRLKIATTVQRIANTFYTKNWTDTVIPFDNISLSSNHVSGYYFPPTWEVVFKNECIFPSNFTEIGFKLP